MEQSSFDFGLKADVGLHVGGDTDIYPFICVCNTLRPLDTAVDRFLLNRCRIHFERCDLISKIWGIKNRRDHPNVDGEKISMEDHILLAGCSGRPWRLTFFRGPFYYVAAALSNASGWQGTNAMLLGDRIVPQWIEIRSGMIIVHYLGRRPDEPFGAPATVDMNRTLMVEDRRIQSAP